MKARLILHYVFIALLTSWLILRCLQFYMTLKSIETPKIILDQKYQVEMYKSTRLRIYEHTQTDLPWVLYLQKAGKSAPILGATAFTYAHLIYVDHKNIDDELTCALENNQALEYLLRQRKLLLTRISLWCYDKSIHTILKWHTLLNAQANHHFHSILYLTEGKYFKSLLMINDYTPLIILHPFHLAFDWQKYESCNIKCFSFDKVVSTLYIPSKCTYHIAELFS